MPSHAERALEFFQNGYNCAQSVVLAYAEDLSLTQHQTASLAAGFGGGIGRKQYTCGAVTGAVMVLGCLFYDERNRNESKARVYEIVRSFVDSFEKTYSCSDCKGLLGVDLSTPIGVEDAKRRNLSREICDGIIRDICKKLDAIIHAMKI